MNYKVLRLFASLFLALAITVAGVTPALAAPPANDNIADAKIIGSLPFSWSVDNSEATTELNEPQNCNSASRTVWYSFTSDTNAIVRANTEGSIFPYTNLSVYELVGPGPFDLTFLGCATYGGSNSVSFSVQVGKTYYLQADSLYGTSGIQQVNMYEVPQPPNDNFANAIDVGPVPSEIDFDTTAATFESGEPPSCGYPLPPYKTIWFAFMAEQDGSISASIPSFTFAPFLAIYNGTSFNNLTQLGCGQYSNKVTFHAVQGQTYYFQVGGYYGEGGLGTFLLENTPPPQVGFFFYPGDPSIYSIIQFCTSSYDPGNVGFESFTWDFGDGATATDGCSPHQYMADGVYTVQHSATTFDGRTASTSQVVQVRTHDVSVTKITAPKSASLGQTKAITVSIRNTRYPETVTVDLYKSVPGGEVWISSLSLQVRLLSGNKTKLFTFNYTFTSQDAQIGKVSFHAVATINGANDSFPQDNAAISSPPTKVGR